MQENLRCPRCRSSQTRYRLKSDDHICYACGLVYKVDKPKEKEEDKD